MGGAKLVAYCSWNKVSFADSNAPHVLTPLIVTVEIFSVFPMLPDWTSVI